MTFRILCISDISISGFRYFEVSKFGCGLTSSRNHVSKVFFYEDAKNAQDIFENIEKMNQNFLHLIALRRCETLSSAREIASMALSAEQARHTENVSHCLKGRFSWIRPKIKQNLRIFGWKMKRHTNFCF